MTERLFPPYLNKGSGGPAVVVLQMMLQAAGFDPHHQITVTGDYGHMTNLAVQRLQKYLGVETDGNFGPMTRAAWRAKTGLDVDRISADIFVGETKPVIPS